MTAKKTSLKFIKNKMHSIMDKNKTKQKKTKYVCITVWYYYTENKDIKIKLMMNFMIISSFSSNLRSIVRK